MNNHFRLDTYGQGGARITYLPTGDTYISKDIASCWRGIFDILKENKSVIWPVRFPADAIDILSKNDYLLNDERKTKIQNAIIDCENDITAMVEGLRVKRDELSALRLRLHAIENPGKPYVDTDLF